MKTFNGQTLLDRGYCKENIFMVGPQSKWKNLSYNLEMGYKYSISCLCGLAVQHAV